MGRLFTTRRSQWSPGLAAAGASIGIAAALGFSLGVRHWAAYLGLFVALLLLSALAGRRAVPQLDDTLPPKTRDKRPRLPQAAPTYDLAKDQSTDNQKYLM